jgi:hypothetical protein
MNEYLAPNGKPSNLTPEQYKLVRTPEFKAWFGDWENDPANASKVVDINGEPLVVYHGTNSDFNIFKLDYSSTNTDSHGFLGSGFYFATNKKDAEYYGNKVEPYFIKSVKNLDLRDLDYKELAFLLPNLTLRSGKKWKDAFIEKEEAKKKIGQIQKEDLKNGFYNIHYQYDGQWFMIPRRSINEISADLIEELILDRVVDEDTENIGAIGNYFNPQILSEEIKKQGYDSVFSQGTNIFDKGDELVVFEPNQIKLADGSNTTFDGNNPDIRFDGGGEVFQNLKLYRVMAHSENHIKKLYFGTNYEEAKREFDIANYDDVHENLGGIILLEELDNKYLFVQELDDEIGDSIDDYPIEDYYDDANVYDLIEETYWESIDERDINPINEVSDKILDDVQDYFKNQYGKYKYNTIDVDNGLDILDDNYEYYGCIQLRISDHSENIANIDRFGLCKYYISVVIANRNATKGRFLQSMYERKSNEVELEFDSKDSFDEIISEIEMQIEEAKEYVSESNFKKGGRTIAQTPAPKKERIYGSEKNKPESSKDIKSAEKIEFNEKTLETIKNKVAEHNEKNPKKKVTLASAKAVVRRGMGAYSSSHRPTIKGGKPNSRVAWGLARLNAFLYKIVNGKSKSGKYNQDDDLIGELGYKVQKYSDGGQIDTILKKEIIDILSKNARYGQQIISVQEVGIEVIQSCIESNTYFGNSIKQANENYIMIPVRYEDKLFAIDKKVEYIYLSKPNENTKIRVEYKHDLQEYPNPVLFDSTIMNSEEYQNINEYEEINSRDFDSEYLYRGINSEEMKSIIDKGFIKSNALMNIGEQQAETTSFAQNISQASSYAVGFNAWYDEVTFAKPKYILKVKKEGVNYKPTIETDIENEVDVYGEIPIEKIESIYEIKLGECQMGSVEINMGYNNDYSEGSRYPMFKKVFVRKTDINTLIDEINSKNKIEKNNDMTNPNPIDKVTFNVPLLIRFAEYMREDVKDDVRLHEIIENILHLKDKEVLTMSDYDKIISNGASKEDSMKSGGQTPAQKEKVSEVMGEFKRGELETSYGEKVTNPKQAIAIALSEAGVERKDYGGYIIDEDISKSQINKPIVGMALMLKEADTYDSVYYIYDIFEDGVRIGLNEGNTTGISLSDLKRKFRPATQEEVNLSKSMNESIFDVLFDEGGKVKSVKSDKGDIQIMLDENWYNDDSNVELVPVSELIKFREFDRKISPKYNKENSLENINHLKFMFQKQGVKSPLIIEYSPEDKSVLLIEGNHRLNSAIDLGMEYLPARVVLKKHGKYSDSKIKNALQVEGIEANQSGYIPSDLKPSYVGIPNCIPLEYREGGIIEGRLHSECGDDGCGRKFRVGENGHVIEAERDEAVIVAKTFEDDDEYTLKGTPSEIASALNVMGGGKNFDKGAEIIKQGDILEIPALKKEDKDTDVDDIIDSGSIIINRRSMADKNEYEVTGTPKQIASAINSINGNGVVIEEGAEIDKS